MLFDLDDTLIDDTASFRRAAAATAAEITDARPGPSADELAEAYIREATAVWTAFDLEQRNGRAAAADTGDALRHESWRRALRACGMNDEGLLRRAVISYAEWRRTTVEVLPGAEQVLDALRGIVRTAVVTNGAADVQRWKLRQLGLEGRVDYTIVSEEFGRNKPHPAIFLHAAEKLGAEPSRCLVVGDSLRADIAGAKAAGMWAAWVNREGDELPKHAARPDFVIEGPGEVLDILRRMEAQ